MRPIRIAPPATMYMKQSLPSLPTYVTYVEFRQALTGPSHLLTTPERSKVSLVTPAQQGVGIWRCITPDWWLIREGQHELGELILEVLEILNDIQMIGDCIPQFGPLNSK